MNGNVWYGKVNNPKTTLWKECPSEWHEDDKGVRWWWVDYNRSKLVQSFNVKWGYPYSLLGSNQWGHDVLYVIIQCGPIPLALTTSARRLMRRRRLGALTYRQVTGGPTPSLMPTGGGGVGDWQPQGGGGGVKRGWTWARHHTLTPPVAPTWWRGVSPARRPASRRSQIDISQRAATLSARLFTAVSAAPPLSSTAQASSVECLVVGMARLDCKGPGDICCVYLSFFGCQFVSFVEGVLFRDIASCLNNVAANCLSNMYPQVSDPRHLLTIYRIASTKSHTCHSCFR